MSRMIDLIRASAVPSNLMQSASKGSLSVPAPEIIEILVYLAVHNKIFGQQAQLTLAGWDEASSRAAAGNPGTPREVLEYLISPKNLRPVLLPALLANPSVSAESLFELAPSAGREVVEVMLKSERIKHSPTILHALLSNPNLTGIQTEIIRNLIEPASAEPAVPEPVAPEASTSEPEPSAPKPGALKKEAAPAPATESTPDRAIPEEEKNFERTMSSTRRPQAAPRKKTKSLTKAFSPIFRRMQPRLPPKLTAFSNPSAAITKKCCPEPKNRWRSRRQRQVVQGPPSRRRQAKRAAWLRPRNGAAPCRKSPSSISRAAFSWP